MFRTLEIRWFWPARDIDAIQAWFFGDGEPPEPELRTDHYLVMPGCAATGVKVREGGLEIKALAGAEEEFSCPGLEGRLGEWVKWSLFNPHFAAIAGQLSTSGDWLPVAKRRVQRQFTLTGSTVMEVPPDRPPPETGCNLELASVIPGSYQPAWLTFNLEAFGPGPELPDQLKRVAADFLRRHDAPPGVTLSAANSSGYPAWLNRLAGDKRLADY